MIMPWRSPLDSASKARILDFVRPLSVGLDGMTNFGFVERRMRISEILLEGEEGKDGAAGGAGADPGRLFLLAAFAGLPSARRITPDEPRGPAPALSPIFHSKKSRILVSSLQRVSADPQSPEEKIVHDAMLLESVGAYGVTQLLVSGARERMTLGEMADEIEAKMDAARFATEAGRRLAGERIAYAKEFAAKLRAEAAEFGAGRDRLSGQSAFGSVSSSSTRHVPFSLRSVTSPVTGPDAPSPAIRSTARSPFAQPLPTFTDLSPCSSRR